MNYSSLVFTKIKFIKLKGEKNRLHLFFPSEKYILT